MSVSLKCFIVIVASIGSPASLAFAKKQTLTDVTVALDQSVGAMEAGSTAMSGLGAFATVATPSATVASVGGGLTQMVNNTETGAPLNQNVGVAASSSAIGTIIGGGLGQLGGNTVTASSSFGGQGALSTAGKVFVEGATTVVQESITQGSSAVLDKLDEE